MSDAIRRITVEEVREAIEKTGAKLERMMTWRGPEFDGKPCGCPIGIVAASKGIYDDKEDCLFLTEAQDALNLDSEYMSGFIHSFDGWPAEECADENYRFGYADGQVVAAALLPAVQS